MQLPHLGHCESHRTLRSKQKSAHQRSYGSLSTLDVFTSASPTPFYSHGEILDAYPPNRRDCWTRKVNSIWAQPENEFMLRRESSLVQSLNAGSFPQTWRPPNNPCTRRRSVSTDPRGIRLSIGAENWSATTTETRHISEKVAYDD